MIVCKIQEAAKSMAAHAMNLASSKPMKSPTKLGVLIEAASEHERQEIGFTS